MTNDTSATMLCALLEAGVEVCAVLIAAERGDGPPIARVAPAPAPGLIPFANPFLERTPIEIAWERGVPVFELRQPGAPETHMLIAELRPDVACVACFPLRIRASLLARAPMGFLNMHPALLPAHRGPAPLFWVVRAGEQTAGVTIHHMDAGLDSGDIVAQEAFELPDGISGAALERRCDAIGARLMVAALRDLRDGALVRRAQPSVGSYESWPAAGDWRIETSWSARRAFNFMRGTAQWSQTYRVRIGGDMIALASAVSYAAGLTLDRALVREGEQVQIQFADGVLRAREA
jgi:methionyl-tRNA formyltransferase